MLFNSYEFLFGFLPVTLLGYLVALRASARLGSAVVAIASVFFYGWWNPVYVPLLLASAAFNFAMSRAIVRAQGQGRPQTAKAALVATIVGDLGLLGYFKYADFFLETISAVTGTQLSPLGLVLPLGISFFTFTQIAFVVDTYRGEASEADPLDYVLFVTWFPHLIAGPVIHHRPTMQQFTTAAKAGLEWPTIAAGSAMLTIGLFKKVVLADGIGAYVAATNAMSAFTKADLGVAVGFFEGWSAALAYTLQLYFDFSGYSDMAIGLSLMFGVKLPANFNSPYQAHNIIEFWRRWHITLSRFLRDYLYIPLGGNRHGGLRRHVNLLLTMLLGGLWHGAGWTFVTWGALHGVYLVVNHVWRSTRRAFGADLSRSTLLGRTAARSLTFVAVVVGWVFFRATTLSGALSILAGMAGLNGFILLEADRAALGVVGDWLAGAGVSFESAMQVSIVPVALWITVLLPVVWWMPNSQQIMGRFPVVLGAAGGPEGAVPSVISWRPSVGWAIAAGVVFTYVLINLNRPSEFLYYQF